MGTPSNVQMDPGLIYVAPVATADPTAGASAALPSAWRAVGYTEDGSTFTWTTNVEAIEVEEEFDPIFYKTTGRMGKFAAQLAESTRQNLALAVNAGADAANDASGLEPPAPNTEIRVKIVVDKANGSRWLFRQCFQGGDTEIANKKAPDKTLVPVEFNLEKPTGATPWKVFPSATGLI